MTTLLLVSQNSKTLISQLSTLFLGLNLQNSFLSQLSLVILTILGGGFWWWHRSEFGSVDDGLYNCSVAGSVMVGGWIEVWWWVSVVEIGVWWWVSFTNQSLVMGFVLRLERNGGWTSWAFYFILFYLFLKSDLGGVVCSNGFVWVVDGFIVLDLWWIVDGYVADFGGFVVVIWGQSRVSHGFVIWGVGLYSWIWVCVLVQDTLRSQFIWFLVLILFLIFFCLFKINKLI